jgi:Tfp pilus assembly protein PilF
MKPLAVATAAVGLFAIALHLRTLHDPFVGDDATYISENPAVTDGVSLRRLFLDPTVTSSNAKPIYREQVWRPLRLLAFRVLVALFGARPEPIRMANILLYGLSAALLVLAAFRLTDHLAASVAAASLWAAWSVHVEPVVYASALGDGISLACVLGAVLVAQRSAALSLLLAAAALLAKEMALTTPALVVLWLLILRAPRRRIVLLACGHALVAVVYLVVRTHVTGQLGQGAASAASTGAGVLGAGRLLLVYARITLAPLGHSAAYGLSAAGTGLRVLCWLAVLAVAACGWRFGCRAVRFGLAWFVISLAPVLQLVPVAADFGDRFAFQPSVGLAIALVGAALQLPARTRRAVSVAAAFAILMYGAGTVVEQYAWSSELSLWHHAADISPESAQAHANYGTALLAAGRPLEALAELDRAQALGWRGREIDLRRSMALADLGRLREAEEAALESSRREPTLGRAWALLGHFALVRGDLDRAEQMLALADTYEPDQVTVQLFAAELAQRQGKSADAARIYAALAIRYPAAGRFQYLAARTELDAGDRASAARHARACLRLEPDRSECRDVLERAAP